MNGQIVDGLFRVNAHHYQAGRMSAREAAAVVVALWRVHNATRVEVGHDGHVEVELVIPVSQGGGDLLEESKRIDDLVRLALRESRAAEVVDVQTVRESLGPGAEGCDVVDALTEAVESNGSAALKAIATVAELKAELEGLREARAAYEHFLEVRWSGSDERQINELGPAGDRLNRAMRAIGLRDAD